MKYIYYTILTVLAGILIYSCSKVSATGLLIGATSVNDRVKMSIYNFEHGYSDKLDFDLSDSISQDYTIIIGSDSHIWEDSCRLIEMCDTANYTGALFMAHCGDLADTQPEPYDLCYRTLRNYTSVWFETHTDESSPTGSIPFFPVVGNHDITHNGFAYFSEIFGSSTYVVNVYLKDGTRDVHLFMDSASGSLGTLQKDFFEKTMANDEGGRDKIRNIYVYTHTNMFRGRSGNVQFASTFPREEFYSLLTWFHDLNESTIRHNSMVICGHIHEYDEYEYGGVKYYNCESMSERNNPDPGKYLLRLHCNANGTSSMERVNMTYSPKTMSVIDIDTLINAE